jgi:hypothetical protein
MGKGIHENAHESLASRPYPTETIAMPCVIQNLIQIMENKDEITRARS